MVDWVGVEVVYKSVDYEKNPGSDYVTSSVPYIVTNRE